MILIAPIILAWSQLNKVTHLKGEGRIRDKNTVIVIEESGKKNSYKTKNIVIGTGSVPTSLPGINIDANSLSIDLFKIARKEDTNVNLAVDKVKSTKKIFFPYKFFSCNFIFC